MDSSGHSLLEMFGESQPSELGDMGGETPRRGARATRRSTRSAAAAAAGAALDAADPGAALGALQGKSMRLLDGLWVLRGLALAGGFALAAGPEG